MKKTTHFLLVAICIGFVTLSYGQRRYAIKNGIGLQGGITQFDILTDNFETKSNSGFLGGMSASVDVFTNTMDGQLSIPIQAVTTREAEKEDDESTGNTKEEFDEVVFIKSADTVRVAKVVTGIQDDEYISIKSGLSEGEEIVTGPYSAISKKLEEGDIVRIKEKEDKKKKSKK